LVNAALKGPAQEGQAVFSLVLTSLLHRAQSPASVLAAAARLSPIAGNIADEKLEALQREPLESLPAEDAVRAAHLAEEYVTLLKELENVPAGYIKDRRAMIRRMLDDIGKLILETTQKIYERQFLSALKDPNGKRRAAVVLNIEYLARALRRLEDAGRRAGGFEAFDRLRLAYAQKLKASLDALDGGGLQRHDIIRLAEILLGGEKAMALAAPPARSAKRG
jgi:phytoene dehydrogenase-like protein